MPSSGPSGLRHLFHSSSIIFSRRIAGEPRVHYSWTMPRLLSLVLLAITLISTPLFMQSGAAAAPISTASAAAHCDETPGEHGSKQVPGMDRSCAATCAAVAPLNGCIIDPLLPVASPVAVPGDISLSGITPERETPPPRLSSKI